MEKRQSLNGLVLLVDIRRGLGSNDTQLLEYAEHLNLDVCLTLTKADKLSKNDAKKAFFAAQKLVDTLANNTEVILFSSLKKQGIDPVHNWLDLHLDYHE
jgi:GTP-binding protein